jgi:hypothetical protein
MSNLVRGILSVVGILVWGWVIFFLNTVGTLATGPVAGKQFDNSDSAFVASQFGTRLFSWVGLILTLLLLALLAAVWWGPLRQRLDRDTVKRLTFGRFPSLALLFLLAGSSSAFAYFDTTDKTEGYFILPNESAFWIPDVGANKDSQGRFEGVDYLNANKVAAKRFIIPHAKLSNSGGNWGYDAYVPTGRLIIVDRTPYNREWVAAKERGTSARNESFPCQSTEGLNITVEISIAASVLEENAARYLYYFGVKPPQGDRSMNQVIFTSVFFGRTLTEVMDGVGRGAVQTLVCNEFSNRTLDKANADARVIIDTVQKNATAFFASRGITLDYIGWAGTFSFDNDVQMAINRAYDANKIAPYLETLKTKAIIDALAKWDGKLPANVSGLWLVPADVMGAITSMIGKAVPAGGAAKP